MLKIAFVGHVDHGKSTLIGRILYDTDSLPEGKVEEIKKACNEMGKKFEFAYLIDALEEERKNQMTIEAAYTFFKSKKREYAIIDVPGHKEFIKNVVTGVSQADVGILLVDVKEGVKEQTKRHAYLLKFLGIEKVIVVINKMDLVKYDKKRFEDVKEEISKYLDSINIKPLAIVPISAYNGDNVVKKSEKMLWYDGPTLIEILDKIEEKSIGMNPIIFIQDEYKRKYLGNLISGVLKKGMILKVYPEGFETKIERIFSPDEVDEVKAPKAVGILTDKKLRRGNVLSKEKLDVENEITAVIFTLRPGIAEKKRYFLKCLTQETPAVIEEIVEKIDIETLEKKEVKELGEIEIARVKIKTEKPIVVKKFSELKELGRFVIMDEGEIIAGGTIMG